MSEYIDISLTPAEVIAIVSAQDRWPAAEKTPDGFFEVQAKISNALDANPAAVAFGTKTAGSIIVISFASGSAVDATVDVHCDGTQ